MFLINNTKDMNSILSMSESAEVEFPKNTNVLLDDEELPPTTVQEMDELAQNLRRSLHRR